MKIDCLLLTAVKSSFSSAAEVVDRHLTVTETFLASVNSSSSSTMKATWENKDE